MDNGCRGLSRHVEAVSTACMGDGSVNTPWQEPVERAWSRPLAGIPGAEKR